MLVTDNTGKTMAASSRDRRQANPRQRQWFAHEVERLMDRLYGTALRLTRDPDDAEDIVAEAISKAWTRLDRLRDPERFEGWLFHILSNTFISEWRRRQCRPKPATNPDIPPPDELEASDFSLFQQLHQPFLLWWGSTEDRFLNDLLQEDLQEALDSLPDIYRMVVVFVEVQGHTYDEVSRLLDIPLGTVRSRLSRARAMLQKRLWEQAGDAGLTAQPRETEEKRP